MSYIECVYRSIMSFLDTCINCKNVEVRCLCQWSEIILNNFQRASENNNNKSDDKNAINSTETTNDYVCLFNREYFWSNIKNKRIIRTVIPLYNMRTITLGAEHQTNLYLGVDPYSNFSIRCQLECKKTNKSIVCDIDGLKKIFEFAHHFIDADICHPKSTFSTSIQDVDSNSKVSLEISRFYFRLFTLTIGASSLKIAENNLEQLLQMETMIHQIVIQLDDEREKLEKNFFDLLHVYHEHHRKKFLIHMYNPVNVQQFFDEIISNPCSCAPKSFLITTAIYFKHWFVNDCLPIYIRTLMLHEENRLKTFKNGNWPHKTLDTELMAMTGLYFLAPFDRVKCVFCAVQMEKWMREDDPLKDHHKYSRYCPLLNELPTDNSNTTDKEYLHQYLKSIANENKGIDEIDCKEEEEKETN